MYSSIHGMPVGFAGLDGPENHRHKARYEKYDEKPNPNNYPDDDPCGFLL